MRSRVLVVAVVTSLVAACGDSSTATDASVPAAPPSVSSVAGSAQRFADVVGAVAVRTDEGWDFDVTVSSPYDSPERYADAWRVVGPDGVVFGVRELLHDHASEQPFTRSLRGVEIPADVDLVVVEARDSTNGWGGQTMDVALETG